MVLLVNKTEFMIKVTVEPDSSYNCILQTFKCPSCKGWSGVEFTGVFDLCPHIPNQEINVGPNKSENVINTGCSYRITIECEMYVKKTVTNYFCFFPYEEEKTVKTLIPYEKHRSYNKNTKKITFDLTPIEIHLATSPDIVGCGCTPKIQKKEIRENIKDKNRSFFIDKEKL